MKKVILLLLFVSMFFTYEMTAQITTNPDTVCVNATGEVYFVTNTAGSTYIWAITAGGGTIQSGQGTNSITADWGATPGLFPGAITITETDINGCIGAPVVLDVYILQPAVTQIGPFCEGDPCVSLVGTPAGGVWTGTGVVLNGAVYEFCPSTSGTGTFTLTYTVGGCSITMDVTVNPAPITGPINHY